MQKNSIRFLQTIFVAGLATSTACAAQDGELGDESSTDGPTGDENGEGDADDEGDGDTSDSGDGDGNDDTAPPTVEILSPVTDTVIGGIVEISAEAEDDVGVAQVEFLIDGERIALLGEAPYTVEWDGNNNPVAEIEITVVARDEAGNEGEASVFAQNFASYGTGGMYPGNVDRSTEINGVPRDYYLYVPTSYDPATPMPLLTVHHGAGGPTYKGEYYREYWTQTAEQNGFIVLSQDSLDDVQGGWLKHDANYWAQEVTQTMEEYNIDRSHVHAWGYSAGGHFGHYLGMTYSTFLASYAVHSGTLGPFQQLSKPAMLDRKIPVGIWVGNTDPNGPSCKNTRDFFIDAGWVLGERLSFTEFTGGHVAPQEHLPDVWAFMSQWNALD